jgi:L-lactate dehydrogenase complex protein LldE
MRVAVFATCLVDGVVPEVGRATVALLERLGCDVTVPERQTCCGQMHVNTGYAERALPLVEHHVTVFEPFDVIVSPSASCVGAVRHQHEWVARRHGRADLAARARALAARTLELSELLVDRLGVVDVGAYYPHRVAYHPTCHSMRLLGVGDRPQRLLRAVRGLELVDLPDATTCCGFGGTFSLKNGAVSTAMLTDKLASIVTTRAERCCAADASCLLHIGGGLSRSRAAASTVHLAQVLASTEERQW